MHSTLQLGGNLVRSDPDFYAEFSRDNPRNGSSSPPQTANVRPANFTVMKKDSQISWMVSVYI